AAKRWVTVLGATGSVGESTLDVVARNAQQYALFALTANTSLDQLARLALEHRPRYAVMRDERCAEQLRERLKGSGVEVLAGEQGLVDVVRHPQVDVVMAAIVGAAGLA